MVEAVSKKILRLSTALALLVLGVVGYFQQERRDAHSMRVLITSFESFGGRSINQSQEMVHALTKSLSTQPLSKKMLIKAVVLPVVYDLSGEKLAQELRSFRPDVVLALGEAGTPSIRLETTAHAFDDSDKPDEKGITRKHHRILAEDSHDQYPSKLPLQQFEVALKEKGIIPSWSDSAGGYVCNHVFYHLMHHLNQPEFNNVRGGFVHVPVNPPSVEWGAQAIRVILDTL